MSNEGAMENQAEPLDVDELWLDLLNDTLDASQRVKLLNQVTADLKVEVSRRTDAAALFDTLHRVLEERPLTEDMWPATEHALLFASGPPRRGLSDGSLRTQMRQAIGLTRSRRCWISAR